VSRKRRRENRLGKPDVNNNTHKEVPYVLTLTIIDASTLVDGKVSKDSMVRICVRDEKTNRTHPNVVSVPTQRIPKPLAQIIIADSVKTGVHDNTILWKQGLVSNEDVDGRDAVIFAVESLLSRKLGVASILEKDGLSFDAGLAGTHLGVAKYDNLNDEEKLHMVNIQVYVTNGTDQFPEITASYNFTDWMSVEEFLNAWDNRHNPESEIRLCVGGLCCLSTSDILRAQTETP